MARKKKPGRKKHCKLPGCKRRQLARGLCRLHYNRWHTTGTTDDPPDHISRPWRSRRRLIARKHALQAEIAALNTLRGRSYSLAAVLVWRREILKLEDDLAEVEAALEKTREAANA
jgi:hypothetical protein